MKHILLLIVGLVLTGCATTPIPASSAKAVPAERLLAFQEDTRGMGTIVVTRDVGNIGSACYNGFSINGKLAARFAVGETANFYVPPGELLLRSGTDPYGRGLCGFGKDHWIQRESVIKPEEIKHFRLSLSADGQPDIHRNE